jgi:hypothetical protein
MVPCVSTTPLRASRVAVIPVRSAARSAWLTVEARRRLERSSMRTSTMPGPTTAPTPVGTRVTTPANGARNVWSAAVTPVLRRTARACSI